MYFHPSIEIQDAELDRAQTLKVCVSSRGDPDAGQDPELPVFGAPVLQLESTSLRHASALCRQYIDAHGLGSGNWAGGLVTDKDATPIAQVSYNGRVWKSLHNAPLNHEETFHG